MPGPFVHNIDPIFAEIGGVYLWYYGLSYTLGFLGAFFWFWRVRERYSMAPAQVYSLAIHICAGVLIGGRTVEVIFYEWDYYGAHLLHIPAVWLGGMSTHGILLGALLGTWLFCRTHRKDFLTIIDELVIPGAYIMGLGRIGNFIDGQIGGRPTQGWWGVRFPDTLDYQHPVVLYDGIKNLAILPLLLYLRTKRPACGTLFAHFVFWYGFLRIFVDLFRAYRTDLFLGIPPGQIFNAFMAAAGVALIVWFSRRDSRSQPAAQAVSAPRRGLWGHRAAFAFLLLLPLIIPSDWTQDVPRRYGDRHEGLRHSILYPPMEVSR